MFQARRTWNLELYSNETLLQQHIKSNDIDNFKRLFERCGNEKINDVCNDGCTLLSCAVRNASLVITEYIIQQKANLNQRERQGGTPLLIATYLGHFEHVQLLIKHGAQIDDADSYGNTPLAIAVREGFLNITKFLIDQGANTKTIDARGLSLLERATKENKRKIAELLLKKGEHNLSNLLKTAVINKSVDIIDCLLINGVNINDCIGEKTPLGWAAEEGHLEVVKILIANGADVNKLSLDGNTPLATAAKHKQFEIVKYLTDISNISKVGENGKTPLLWAVQNKDCQMTEWLLDNGAAYFIDDIFLDAIETKELKLVQLCVEKGAVIKGQNKNMSPLMKSLEVGSVEIAKYLVEKGAPVIDDFKKDAPLLSALQKQDYGLVNLFLNHGAANIAHIVLVDAVETRNLPIVQLIINTTTDKKELNQALIKALDIGSIEIAKCLLQKGAHFVDDLVKNEISYMVEFLGSNNFEMVKLLTENGARLNMSAECGHTPLTKSIKMENFAMVKYFVERAANVNQADQNGTTPLAAAASNDDVRIIGLLLDSGATLSEAEAADTKLSRYYQMAKEKTAKKGKHCFKSDQEGANDD